MGEGPSEKRIQNEALVAVSALPGVMAWRNNTGTAWQGEKIRAGVGQMVRVEAGMVILRQARPISFGLPGSADILGVARGRAFALEAKTLTGQQAVQQRKFQLKFEGAGGLYGVFRSPERAVALVRWG